LAETIQLRDAMLTGVTHDLRTPLTVIKLQAQLLRRRPRDQPASAGEQIERAATRMARWIDELLEVATVKTADELHLALETTDLLQLVRQVVAEHAQSAQRHEVTIETDRIEIVGQFDASRIVRVMDNLVGNAIKYSPHGGTVRVQVAADDQWATITVSDCGLGIPADDLPHVFELFRRGGNVVGQFSGTGIGLSSAHRIVHRHGGTMSVASTSGLGATFTVCLPLHGTRSPELATQPE
jgi:signal transduction histidine kinase